MIIFLHVLVSMHRNIALVIPVWASKEIKQNSTQKCSFYQANHKLIPLGGGGELIIWGWPKGVLTSNYTN